MLEPIYDWLQTYLSLTNLTGPLPDYDRLTVEYGDPETSKDAIACWHTIKHGKKGEGSVESLRRIVELFSALLLKEAGCHPSPAVYITTWVTRAVCGIEMERYAPSWVNRSAMRQLDTLLSVRYGKQFQPVWGNTVPLLWAEEWPDSGEFVIQVICSHWAEDMKRIHGEASTIDDWTENHEEDEAEDYGE